MNCTRRHLDAVLGQLRLDGEHLSSVDVRVVGLVEGFLQFLQLVGREHGPGEAGGGVATLGTAKEKLTEEAVLR